jgi:hypothetical protein
VPAVCRKKDTIMQNPSVGRIVHYHDSTAVAPQAAIIIGVHSPDDVARRWPTMAADISGLVCLHVFPADRAPHGLDPIPYSEMPKPGHWSWPPRA